MHVSHNQPRSGATGGCWVNSRRAAVARGMASDRFRLRVKCACRAAASTSTDWRRHLLNSASAPWALLEAALKHTASNCGSGHAFVVSASAACSVEKCSWAFKHQAAALFWPAASATPSGVLPSASRAVSASSRPFRTRSRALEDAPAAQAASRLVATRGRAAPRARPQSRPHAQTSGVLRDGEASYSAQCSTPGGAIGRGGELPRMEWLRNSKRL